MKIGILTFHGADNYGSVLQAYALTKYLNKNGHEAEIIDYYFEHDYRQYKVFRTYRYIKNPGSILTDLMSLRIHLKRRKNFSDFRRTHLPLSKIQYDKVEQLYELNNKYDCFICGSDQIWNLNCTEGINDAYFLKFVSEDVRKIAYAPSIGMDNISEIDAKKIANEINSFAAISLREKSAIKTLQSLCKKEIINVVDPTLLLDASDYEHIELLHEEKEEPYVFVYVLGSTRTYAHVMKYGQELAEKKGIKIKYIVDSINSLDFIKGDNVSGCNPSEFLRLIKGADYVVSNSFHATVFSIIYEKEFIAIKRNNSSSRMIDLLQPLGLENRILDENNTIDEEICYKQVKERLADMCKGSKSFLQNILMSTASGE